MEPLRPLPPPMRESTRMAIRILCGIAVAAIFAPWMPSPAGSIVAVVIILVGLPLLVLIASDLSQLRQNRMLARHVEIYGTSPDDPDLWVDIHYQPLALEHLTRWRRWKGWLLVILGLAVVAGLLGAPFVLPLIVTAVGVAGELFFAANVMEWLTPADWPALARAERMRLRFCLLLMGTMGAAIALLVVGIIGWLAVYSRPVRWNLFAFAAVYGSVGVLAGVRGVHFLRQCFRAVPPDEHKAERPV